MSNEKDQNTNKMNIDLNLKFKNHEKRFIIFIVYDHFAVCIISNYF